MKKFIKIVMLLSGIGMIYCFYSAIGYMVLASKQPKLIAVNDLHPDGFYTGFYLMSFSFWAGVIVLASVVLVLNKVLVNKMKTLN